MKTNFLIIIITFYCCSLMAQQTSTISFDYENLALTEVMEDLENRYALNFSFSNDPVLLSTDISASGDNIPLENGLDIIFQDQPIAYKLIAGNVVVRYEKVLSDNGSIEQKQFEPEIENVPVSAPERITYDPPRKEVSDVDPLPSRKPGLFSVNVDWDDDHDHDWPRWRFNRHDRAGGLEFYTSEIFNYHFSFKNGGQHFYSMINLSSDRIWPWNYKRSDPQWAFGVGLGYRAYLFRIPLRTELIVNHINEDKFISTRLNELGQLRVLLGVPFLGGEVTIGPSFNFHISGVLDEETDRIGSNLLPGWERSETNDEIGYYYWVGATIGFLF